MRRYGHAPQVHILFMQQEVIADKIDDDIQHGGTSTACQVTEILLTDPLREGFMEKINDR